jgi:hypothetical protein
LQKKGPLSHLLWRAHAETESFMVQWGMRDEFVEIVAHVRPVPNKFISINFEIRQHTDTILKGSKYQETSQIWQYGNHQ